MSTHAVVYLARAADGLDRIERFLSSYRTHPAGMPHDLVLLLKGCNADQATAIRGLAQGAACAFLQVPDAGFDLGSYFHAAHRIDHDQVCFLNTHSHIQVPEWLAIMAGHMDDPAVAMVGATGSWESQYTSWALTRRNLFRPADLLRDVYYRTLYPPWPNVHLRSNAFLIARQNFLESEIPIEIKLDASRYESGWSSLSRRLRRQGRNFFVIRRDGQRYAPDQFPWTGTFRSGRQENLLIADNRTDIYLQAPPAERSHLARLAWGPEGGMAASDTVGPSP
jgi:hypothetical protein